MSREERIKEIAKDIPFLELEREVIVSSDMKTRCSWMLSEEDTIAIAEVLYDKGYKKLSKEAQEMVSNALVYSKRLKIEKSAEQVRKGTAKEILTRIKNMYKENGFCINHTTKLFIEQLAKEYGAELKE